MNLTKSNLPKVLADIVTVDFDSSEVLKNAFVHRSYLNENHDFTLPSNERLEFLGDAVLQLLTSNYLFQNYSDDEGLLTNYRSALVNTVSLAEVARDLELGTFLFLAKGEEANGGRDREYILANTFEAFLGAIYLEQGLDSCRILLEKVLFPKLEDIIKTKSYKDYKSVLQEKAQERYSETPQYTVLNEEGPDHDKIFTVAAVVAKKTLGTGNGPSKQKAEQAAAQEALEKLWQ